MNKTENLSRHFHEGGNLLIKHNKKFDGGIPTFVGMTKEWLSIL